MVRPREICKVSSATNAELHCGAHISWPTEAVSGLLEHHAIVVAWRGDYIVKVIHVIQKENEHEVCEEEVDLEYYIKQRKVHRYDYDPKDVYQPDEVLQRARRKLGKFEYHVINNNCEHFVCWCKYNVEESSQASTAKKAAAATAAAAVVSSIAAVAIVVATVPSSMVEGIALVVAMFLRR